MSVGVPQGDPLSPGLLSNFVCVVFFFYVLCMTIFLCFMHDYLSSTLANDITIHLRFNVYLCLPWTRKVGLKTSKTWLCA